MNGRPSPDSSDRRTVARDGKRRMGRYKEADMSRLREVYVIISGRELEVASEVDGETIMG